MKNLSRFDLGMIIAFVVVTLLGVGGWWYLSTQLQTAQNDVANADASFKKYSSNAKYHVVVSPSNRKNLEANIDLLKSQLGPLIQDKLVPKENKLPSIDREDPVAWKHDLDDEVNRLKSAAKLHTVSLPANFYFGFSRYLSQSPNDQQTAVLSKQLVGIEQLTTILINGSIKSITAIRRTYEEEPRGAGGGGGAGTGDVDRLAGYSLAGPNNTYTAYPFEVDFETTAENLRTVVKGLIESPYVFVIRSLRIQNSKPTSPQTSDLDKLAGVSSSPSMSVTGTPPGEVASTPVSTKGPQFLFGDSRLNVKARVDMIEWTADMSSLSAPAVKPGRGAAAPTPGAHSPNSNSPAPGGI